MPGTMNPKTNNQKNKITWRLYFLAEGCDEEPLSLRQLPYDCPSSLGGSSLGGSSLGGSSLGEQPPSTKQGTAALSLGVEPVGADIVGFGDAQVDPPDCNALQCGRCGNIGG